jgi:hypothetical protein
MHFLPDCSVNGSVGDAHQHDVQIMRNFFADANAPVPYRCGRRFGRFGVRPRLLVHISNRNFLGGPAPSAIRRDGDRHGDEFDRVTLAHHLVHRCMTGLALP